MSSNQPQPMSLFAKNRKNYLYACLALLMSLIFSFTSFWIGREENISQQSCDPFKLIRDTLPPPTPTISALLKQTKS